MKRDTSPLGRRGRSRKTAAPERPRLSAPPIMSSWQSLQPDEFRRLVEAPSTRDTERHYSWKFPDPNRLR